MSAPLTPALDHPYATPPQPGEAIEVAPRIFWLRMPLPFALDHINLWLIEEADGWTQIDCGIASEATRALWLRHFATTLDGLPIKRVVATHYHPDHFGNAAWLATRFACPVAMTHAEYLTAHAVAGGYGGYEPDAIISLFRRHGMSARDLELLSRRGSVYRQAVPELPRWFERMIDGDLIRMGAMDWRVIEGHGHSPEHASLHCEDAGILISGDMLLPKISTNISVWPVDAGGDPLSRFLDSLAVFETLPADTLVLPSHGLPFSGIALRVAQLRAHHAARLDELDAAVMAAGYEGCTAADMVPVLFRRELDVHQGFFAMGEAIAHLNHLWHGGRIVRRDADNATFRFAPAETGMARPG